MPSSKTRTLNEAQRIFARPRGYERRMVPLLKRVFPRLVRRIMKADDAETGERIGDLTAAVNASSIPDQWRVEIIEWLLDVAEYWNTQASESCKDWGDSSA